MITLDGTMGEGGGQVLRTALALSLVTQQPFQIWNIRGGRERPGLLRQHLTGVRAAAAIGDAKVKGDALGARELTFIPRGCRAGEYRFAVESAGSATLVLQTVLPALASAPAPSTVTVQGGTHNLAAPPFEFIDRVFAPVLGRLGCDVALRLERRGFYPRGGGCIHAVIQPADWQPLELCERGPARGVHATAVVAGLPRHIAERELRVIQKKLGWADDACTVVEAPAREGPGNVVMAELAYAHTVELCTAFGRKGQRAESVATACVRSVKRWLAVGAAVGEHLADQLLLPLAVGAGGRFRTTTPTAHTHTNAAVIRAFLPERRITIAEQPDETWLVEVGAPAG